MKETQTKPELSIFETVDEFIGAVPWTRRRMVLVFLRHHGARTFVRLRTFNRHRKKGCWYPSPRYFVVPQECARGLARAIESAASGTPFGEEPDWYRDFEKQYNARQYAPTADSETDGALRRRPLGREPYRIGASTHSRPAGVHPATNLESIPREMRLVSKPTVLRHPGRCRRGPVMRN